MTPPILIGWVTLSRCIGVRFFVEARHFFVYFARRGVCAPFSLFFRFFRTVLRGPPNGSLVLRVNTCPRSKGLHEQLRYFKPTNRYFRLQVFVRYSHTGSFSVFVFRAGGDVSFRVVVGFLFSQVPITPYTM